jgi:CRISPR-associated protein Cas2
MMFFMVCYDISNDRKRTYLAKILGAYGNRVQESVFEVRVSEAQLKELRQRLQDAAGEEDYANVRFYPLCANCRAKACDLGETHLPGQPAAVIV